METQTQTAESSAQSVGDLGNPNPTAQIQQNSAPPPEAAKSFTELLDDKGGFKQGWTQALPEHLKAFEGTLGKYPNPFEALSALGNAQKFISSRQTLKPLDANATPEQAQQYYAELRKITGAPEKPEDYGIKAPEGKELSPLAGEFAKMAHEHGIPPAFVHKAVDLYNKGMGDLVEQAKAAQTQDAQAAIAELNQEWGADAANTWDRAKRGIVALGGDPKKDTYTIQDVMRMALNADRMIRPDDTLIGTRGPTQTVDERMTALQKDPAYQNPKTTADFKRQAEIANELQRLHAYKKQIG